MKKHKQSKSSTSFMMTLNQPERFPELRDYLKNLKHFQYGVAGEEYAPKTGHRHYQIFIQFDRSCRLTMDRLEGAHIERCYGTPQQNQEYAKKDGNIVWEEGCMKTKGWLTIAEVEKMNYYERRELPIQYRNIVAKLDAEDETITNTDNMMKRVKVYYISGRSGIGKTTFAKYLIGDKSFNIVKYVNGFWIGVSRNCDIALYDDWRDTHMLPSEFLNFIDYNKQVMNTKGGYVLNRYTLIVITSIFRLDEIYIDIHDESRYQWIRRVKEIYLSTVYNDERKRKIDNLFVIIIRIIKIYIIKLIKNFK